MGVFIIAVELFLGGQGGVSEFQMPRLASGSRCCSRPRLAATGFSLLVGRLTSGIGFLYFKKLFFHVFNILPHLLNWRGRTYAAMLMTNEYVPLILNYTFWGVICWSSLYTQKG